MFSMLQSFEIVWFFVYLFERQLLFSYGSFLPFCGPFLLPSSSHQNSNSPTLKKRILAKTFLCCGRTGFCFVITAQSLICKEYKRLYLEISGESIVFVLVEETSMKTFLLEVSEQNLNLRAQPLSPGWVANLRSSCFNLNSKSTRLETSVHIPHQFAKASLLFVLFSCSPR